MEQVIIDRRVAAMSRLGADYDALARSLAGLGRGQMGP